MFVKSSTEEPIRMFVLGNEWFTVVWLTDLFFLGHLILHMQRIMIHVCKPARLSLSRVFPMLLEGTVCHYSVGLCTAEALNLLNMGSEGPAFFPPQVNSCCCGYRSATVQTLFNVYRLLWPKIKRTSCMSRMWESASPAVCVTFRVSSQLQCMFCNRRGPQSQCSARSPTEESLVVWPVTRRNIQ